MIVPRADPRTGHYVDATLVALALPPTAVALAAFFFL
jgi:hypothetical protein